MLLRKPYLILPEFIEQPTWGGFYIAEFKKLNHTTFKNKKIGQSYELFGSSRLQIEPCEIVTISDIADAYATDLLGFHTVNTFGKMPLLIKFTQSKGNSFQLHVRKQDETQRWKAKPESWYYFEDGLATIGLNPEADIDAYKNTCLSLETLTLEISKKVKDKTLAYESAMKKIEEAISRLNPWQYVTMHRIPKNTVIDLSEGGVHHSWEEDPITIPNGNIVYEVQLDVDDPSSTLRSFDKGKMTRDGTIRELHIKDYFSFINTIPSANTLSSVIRKPKAERIIQTPFYCLDEVVLTKEKKNKTQDSFVHLFIRSGDVEISSKDGSLKLSQGQSCFIPHHAQTYTTTPQGSSVRILKTYITSH